MLNMDQKKHWKAFLNYHYDSIIKRYKKKSNPKKFSSSTVKAHDLNNFQHYACVKYLWKWFNAIY